MKQLKQCIQRGVEETYSDIHVSGGHPLVYRKNGVINFDNNIRWTHEEIDELVRGMLTTRELGVLRTRKSVDIARTIQNVRLRINVFNTTRGLALALRFLPGQAPTIRQINIHPMFEELCGIEAGLILLCGPMGCGKSTTIASMIEHINRTRFAHIVTMEDPIEYRYVPKRSYIEQRELGNHMISFEQGLLDVLREMADVIIVGELREPETIRLTLNASEAGHLVIATLHASNTEDALHRLCNSFPPDSQEIVRTQLSASLQAVIVQKLEIIPKLQYRVPVLSIMRSVSSVKSLIRENKFTQIESAMQTSRSAGMFTMEHYRNYLSSREDFVPPTVTFRPSEELAYEAIYSSPLMREEPTAPQRIETGLFGDRESVVVLREPIDTLMDETRGARPYVIKEELPVKDLLKEFGSDQGDE